MSGGPPRLSQALLAADLAPVGPLPVPLTGHEKEPLGIPWWSSG